MGNSLLLRLNEKAILDPTSIDTIETMNGDENGNEFHEPTESSMTETPVTTSESDLIIPNNKTDVIYFASEFGTNESKKPSSTYSFEYCDHLINIGPCGYAIVGEGDIEETRPLQRHLPPHYQTTPLDLVTTSGHNKSGSISILQQTIKPELITTQALPGSIDMWTVYSSIYNPEQKREHSFILISQETSTLIFQTGVDITELEQGGFLTNEQTIFCGNIGEEWIVQVTRLHIVLLRDSTQIQILSYENNPIRFATSLDRYLAILTTHGVIYIYILLTDPNEPARLLEYSKLTDKKYTCVSLYVDHSGLFTTTTDANLYSYSTILKSPKRENNQQTVVPITANPLDSTDFAGGDDEDEWLYGGKTTENPLAPESMETSTKPSTTDAHPNVTNTNPTNVVPVTRWLMAISRDGTLSMHELMSDETIPPTIRFEIARLNNALKVLVDTQDTTPPMTNYLGKIENSCSAFVYELLIISFGPKQERVYMIVSVFERRISFSNNCYPRHVLMKI